MKSTFKGNLTERIKRSVATYDVDVFDLVVFAKAYADLGSAVQEQLNDILSDPQNADVNPNAVKLIDDRLGGMNDEIDAAIKEWRANRAKREDLAMKSKFVKGLTEDKEPIEITVSFRLKGMVVRREEADRLGPEKWTEIRWADPKRVLHEAVVNSIEKELKIKIVQVSGSVEGIPHIVQSKE